MPRPAGGIRIAARIACVLALSLAAIAAIVAFQERAASSGRAQVYVATLKNDLGQAVSASWNAAPDVGGSPAIAGHMLDAAERGFNRAFAQLRRDSPLPELDEVPPILRAEYQADERIYQIGSTRGYGVWINAVAVPQTVSMGRIFGVLDQANRQYVRDANRAHTLSMIGTAVAILLLAAAFLAMYRRAYRLAERNRQDAVTDALTGLANRRALIHDLEVALAQPSGANALTLAMFDLDGFKQYNDAFGHAAGDALLARLARGLHHACAGRATPYRLGGDEFCLLGRVEEDARDALLADAGAALSGSGEAWSIGCSAGVVTLPVEAQTASDALALADVRMYSTKRSRSSAARQTTDALLRVLDERSPNLGSHTDNVASLAEATAAAMGLDEGNIREVVWAAELHDVGKVAIPDAILDKPGPLDPDEWKLMRRHTLLGERIMLAAPALAGAARLVRASHERVDGTGYPEGLRGEEIPLGARIIFVCDAFDAMTSRRPYSEPMSATDALAELRRCAGSQFDPEVIEAFAQVADGRSAVARQLAA